MKISDLQESPHPACGHLLPEGEEQTRIRLKFLSTSLQPNIQPNLKTLAHWQIVESALL
jgi:hypothetical protein